MRTCLSSIVSAIRKSDFLGESPKLKVNGLSSFQTFIGGFISLVLIILSLIGVGYFGKELFLKENPMVIQSIKDFDIVGPFKFGLSSFDIYAAITDKDFNFYLDERVMEFTASEELILLNNGTQSFSSRPLEIKACKNYYNTSAELGNKVDLNLFYCIKPNTTFAEGYWGSQTNQYVKIYINKCTNRTDNNNHCYSNDKIDSIIEGSLLSMFWRNSMLQMQVLLRPIQRQEIFLLWLVQRIILVKISKETTM